MKGMFLVFGNLATVEAAAEEYIASCEFDESWYEYLSEHERLAQLISGGKGLAETEVLAYLIELYGSPPFKSPAQRRWYFGTHPKDRGTARPAQPKGMRWQEIIQQAREVLKAQPKVTGPELAGMIDMDPPLTPEEEERVQKLVSSERGKKLVRPPRAVPKEERTPETYKRLEEEWSETQKEKEEQKEKEVAKPLSKGPSRLKLGPSEIPPISPPGLPYVGASKGSQKEYFLEQYPEIADGDHWRAFQQVVQLIRSGVEDKDISDVIDAEYPEVDSEQILKAAKGFIKEGSKDPYVHGRVLAQDLIHQGKGVTALAAEYSDLQWRGLSSRFVLGFWGGLPPDVLRAVRRKTEQSLF